MLNSFDDLFKVSLAHLLNIHCVTIMHSVKPLTLAKLLSLPKLALIVLIKGYQKFISPLLGPHCRYNPTCSSYAIQAINCHGSLKGSWLALKRILKCHPLSAGGDDPVPEKSNKVKH